VNIAGGVNGVGAICGGSSGSAGVGRGRGFFQARTGPGFAALPNVVVMAAQLAVSGATEDGENRIGFREGWDRFIAFNLL
jgi:hypothetical protein